MYNDYFGFEDEPFRLTPDPEFFYCSPIHEEAIELIEYGIKSRKGFMMLTGEVGTGKTTLCRVLLNEVRQTETSLILNPLLSSNEILRSIVADFGIKFDSDTGNGELYNILAEYFTSLYQQDKNALIIIDEAQNLSFESFEMIRQISNIEMENAKLVQILLVGQPELPEKLSKHEYRQLAQRIALTAELKGFNLFETENYVNYRLQQALRFNKYIFTKGALKELYKKSGGFPRAINQIADHALLIASANNNKNVSSADIKAASGAYKISSGSKKQHNYMFALLLILFFILTTAVYISGYLNINLRDMFINNSVAHVVDEKTEILTKNISVSPDQKVSEKSELSIEKNKTNLPVIVKVKVRPREFFAEEKPIVQKKKELCVKLKSNMNFRFEPLLINNIVKILPIDSEYKLMDNKKGWIKLTENGVIGWVVADNKFVKIFECGD